MRARRWALVALLGLLATTSLRAHTLSVAHLEVEVGQAGQPMQVNLELAIRDLALNLPLDENRDEQVTWGELQAASGQIHVLVDSGLRMSTQGGRCSLEPAGLATRRYSEGTYAVLQMRARCPHGTPVTLDYSMLMERDPQHRALVTVRRGPAVTTAIARAGAQRIQFPLDSTKGRNPLAAFVREGVHHILIGYDHLAFLVSLLLPAALVRERGQWQPAANLRTPFLHVLGIVTSFTVAHSITLSLAALGWITPASQWVEAAIAASVLLAALNNLRPLVIRRLWVVGFIFGLIHGFGFAGALAELGLPAGDRLWALVGFNLGVELGQIAVVLVLLPVLFSVRRQRWYPKIAMPLASLAIAGLAAWWLWQRVAA